MHTEIIMAVLEGSREDMRSKISRKSVELWPISRKKRRYGGLQCVHCVEIN